MMLGVITDSFCGRCNFDLVTIEVGGRDMLGVAGAGAFDVHFVGVF